MGQVTVYAVAGIANWNDADKWAANADGTGTTYTNPQNGADTYICDLNGKTGIAINVAISVDQIRTGATNAGGQLAVPNSTAAAITVATADTGLYSNYAGAMVTWGTGTCSLTINGDVTYASTATTGMLTYTTNQTLTVNGTVTNSAAGYAIVGAGSGILAVSNVGSTAVYNTSTGRCVQPGGSGPISISGNIVVSAGIGLYNNSSSVASVFNGNITISAGYGVIWTAGTLTWTPQAGVSTTVTGGIHALYVSITGVVVIVGTLSTANTSALVITPIYVLAGTLQYTGAATLAASANCEITQAGGTVALATAAAALSLANSGTFVIRTCGGTVVTTSGANTASIVNQTATSYAAILGGTDANKAIITGASIPAAADTRYGVARGWADGGTSATAGCGVAGGNGLIEMPNTASPTGTQDATSDACVVSGKKYGSPQRTGSAAAGYTYGDESQAKVLTTATGAGTYIPVAAADVRAGTAVGVDPAVGTLDLPAVADVLADVQFDNETKTGLFVVPIEADVKAAVDYGIET